MEDLWFILKHPVAMNSMFSGTIPPPSYSVVNSIFSARIPFTNQAYALFLALLASPILSSFLLWACAKSIAHRKNTRCTMETSQNIRKSAQSGRNIGPEPQNLTLINEDLEVRASFEYFRCMAFCKKILGFNMRLAE